MSRLALLFSVGIGCFGIVPAAHAQQPAAYTSWEAPSADVTIPRVSWPADSLVRVGDYMWEGAAVGAILLGTLGAVIAASGGHDCPLDPTSDCSDSRLDDALVLGGVGAVGGGLAGMLIGLLSPKYAPATAAP